MKHLRFAAAVLALLASPALAQAPAPAMQAPSGRSTPAAVAPNTGPAPAPAPRGKAAGTASADINSATEAQLAAVLPGVGAARAKAIVAGRPYTDLQDLVTKKVLSQGVLDGARDHMALANINTASAADLQRTLPGIGEVRSKAIVAGRPYAKPEDLVGKNVLTQDLFDKIRKLVVS